MTLFPIRLINRNFSQMIALMPQTVRVQIAIAIWIICPMFECFAQTVSFLKSSYTVPAGSSITLQFKFDAELNPITYIENSGPGSRVGDTWIPSFKQTFLRDSGIYTLGTFIASRDSEGEVIVFSVSARSAAFTTVTVTAPLPPPSGSLRVLIKPQEVADAGAMWSIDSASWHKSGDTIHGINVGERTITFSPFKDSRIPIDQKIAIIQDATIEKTGVYITPHTAKITAVVKNGFVVSSGINDPGFGYTESPTLYIGGGGGTGATAKAMIFDSQISEVFITNAGSGYTNRPQIVINPPPGRNPNVEIKQSALLSFAGASTNLQYQVQHFISNSWINVDIQFTPTNSYTTYYFDSPDRLNAFRLIQLPYPKSAIGKAKLQNGFLVGIDLVDSGIGYKVEPSISIVGGGGSGASAKSVISNGHVIGISVISAGIGYSGDPIIEISPPTDLPISLPAIVKSGLKLTSDQPIVSDMFQLEATTDLLNWSPYGSNILPTTNGLIRYLSPQEGVQAFRIVFHPQN